MSAKKPSDSYDARRARNVAAYSRESRAARDIAPLPPVADPRRRIDGTKSFRSFCETYLRPTFTLSWSADQLRIISKIESTVLHGGQFAMAMPRGAGKTSFCEAGALWAVLIGAQQFVLVVGSDEGSAEELIESIKTELSTNDLLYQDFPEVIHPIRKLDGVANRAAGQLYCGEATRIVWSDYRVVLPTIRGSQSSGAIIRTAGITGRIRGMAYKRKDGTKVRPTLVIVDDPQTEQSAESPGQVAKRMRVINKTILGLPGPSKKIACVIPCTVIVQDDLACRLLDRERSPEWQGERTKALYAFPTNMALWEEYAKVRADSFRAGNAGREATEFYRARRAEMDEGARPAWEVRFDPDELSAVQNCMNLLIRDKAAFWAEHQNDPLINKLGSEEAMPADEIVKKISGYARRSVPIDAEHVTAFVDVQGELLYYLVAAWSADFTGAVIDYGTFPDQHRAYFTLADARRTLSEAFPSMGLEGRIYAGLDRLTSELADRVWLKPGGDEMRVSRLLIDANWEKSANSVFQVCRASKHAAIMMPSRGKGFDASSLPFEQYKRKPGETLGEHWWIPTVKQTRSARTVMIDTNWWKTFVQSRLRTALGDKGCLSLFSGHDHHLISEHLTAEYGVTVSARGREMVQWKLRPNRPDNHWLDCLTGCAVAGSMCGVKLQLGMTQGPKPKSGPAPQRRRVVTYL